jgi:hypothetical protein
MVLGLSQERADSLSGTGMGCWPHDHLGHNRDGVGDDISHPQRLSGRHVYSLNQPGNPTETFLSGFRTAVVYLIGTVYTVFSIWLLIGDPLTHFLWVAGSLFLSFYSCHCRLRNGRALGLRRIGGHFPVG